MLLTDSMSSLSGIRKGREMTAGIDLDGAASAIKLLLEAFGVDEGDHTANTPERVARAWSEQLIGYEEDPAEHLRTTFSAPDDPGLVIVSGIHMKSTCAHHLLPFCGSATVAYRPNPGQRVVGLSKLSRVLHGYARRLQVQERIGADTVDAIHRMLNPSGIAVIITATHDCMRLRGVGDADAVTTTVAKHGLLTDDEWHAIRQAHFGR